MSKPDKEDRINADIISFSCGDNRKPSILICEDGTFHIAYYAGMGNANNIPIEKVDPLYKIIIMDLYESKKLKEVGDPFTLYPSSGLFKKLVFVDG
ncbi:hypothetical protein [Shewanella gaetbuli]